tara:strand:- start:3125 stop:5233 length:2109 start_codon:yes stop_codon:yes gene_type:complete
MSDNVSLEVVNNIALVTVNEPPVNAINQQMRAGLLEAFKEIDQRDDVAAALLICDGRTFMAGADLNEFDTGVGEPNYREAYAAIENCSKIVVTAMHGTALGGGLEAALSCHYRCAVANARLGLPELSLGIIPGAGGTQRLPRVVGAKAAVEMIFGIAAITAKKALEIGLIDRILDGDLKTEALAYVEELLAADSGVRKTSDMTVDTEGYDDAFISEMKALAGKRMRGQNAPHLLLQAIDDAINLPFEEGIRQEHLTGEEAIVSDEARGLRHVFFAEREIGRIPGLDKAIEALPIKTVGILGSGTMGIGISIAFADAGLDVTIVDPSAEALERGLALIEETYNQSTAKGRISEAQKSERFGRISGAASYDSLSNVDLVIEAVFEDMDLKKKVFAELDGVCKPGAILASNTSTLDINEMAAMTKRPESVIGLHFFSPANIMKLLEIVRTDKTSSEVVVTALKLAKQIRKMGVVVGIGSEFGFVGNRMLTMGYMREADQMLLEGASIEQIDQAIYEFGFPMGPWAMNDMAGVDILNSVLESTGATAANPKPFFNVSRALAALGRAGQKSGSGFYKYEPGDRRPHHDPLVDDIIKQEAAKLNIEPRKIDDDEIQQRCIYALINEGAKLLAEGIVYRAADIDVIWHYGYGFPRYKGGPMFYADLIGVKEIYETICHFQDQFGHYWTPAPLLEILAKDGTGFLEWTPD